MRPSQETPRRPRQRGGVRADAAPDQSPDQFLSRRGPMSAERIADALESEQTSADIDIRSRGHHIDETRARRSERC